MIQPEFVAKAPFVLANGRLAIEYRVPSAKRYRRESSFFSECQKRGLTPSLPNQRQLAEERLAALRAEHAPKPAIPFSRPESRALTAQEIDLARRIVPEYMAIESENKSPEEMLRVYRAHLLLSKDSPPLREALAVYVARREAKMENDRLALSTFRTSRQRLRRFGKFLSRYKVGEIGAKELAAFLRSLGKVSRKTIDNYITEIGAFFSAASNPDAPNQMIAKNPMGAFRYHMDEVEPNLRPKQKREEPSILSLAEAKKALAVAWHLRASGALGYCVFGMFLGLRPSEISFLASSENPWQYFLEEKARWKVSYGKRKQDFRDVEIKPNAMEWIRLIRSERLPLGIRINPYNRASYALGRFRRFALLSEDDAKRLFLLDGRRNHRRTVTEEDRAFRETKEKELAARHDVFRHTFGTYYYHANNFDMDLTLHMMGNSTKTMFLRHYRGSPISVAEVSDLWQLTPIQIVPKTCDNIGPVE